MCTQIPVDRLIEARGPLEVRSGDSVSRGREIDLDPHPVAVSPDDSPSNRRLLLIPQQDRVRRLGVEVGKRAGIARYGRTRSGPI